LEAADGNAAGHFFPPVLGEERVEDGFEGDAVKRVAGMVSG